MIVLLCDGSCIKSAEQLTEGRGDSSIGVIVWHRGETKSSVRKTTPINKISRKIGIKTNIEAEWEAVLAGVECALSIQNIDKRICIYTDSQLVVGQASGEWKCKALNLIPYLKKYKELTQGLNVSIGWIPRQLTCLADKEASK